MTGRFLVLLAVIVLIAAGCGDDDETDTTQQVERYCTSYRAYAAAGRRVVEEQDRERAVEAADAATAARAAMIRDAPPSLADEYLTMREWQVMSGEDRNDNDNRMDYLMAVDRVDVFAEEHCTLG